MLHIRYRHLTKVVPMSYLLGKNIFCAVGEGVSEKLCLRQESRGTLEEPDTATLFLMRSCTQHFHHADLHVWGMLSSQL